MTHTPVLKEEVLQYLNPNQNENFIDCTAGEGGHTLAIIEKTGPNGKVLALDRDERNVELIKTRVKKSGLESRIVIKTSNYAEIKEVVQKEGFDNVSGILFDLGLSSWHLDESERGFSFKKDEPLDMRYNNKEGVTAWDIINSWPPEEIEGILREFGEERFAKKIAKVIVAQRKIKKIDTASDLAKLVERAVPKTKKIHPATQTFQALRIAVNGELDNLKIVIPTAINLLNLGGRLVVISFHSLEDRIVKNFLKEMGKNGKVQILTKKPIIPGDDEIKKNPRSRSAKLRAAIKI